MSILFQKKTEKYWPDVNGKVVYNNIHVQYRSAELYADYEYRTFTITCEGEDRQVTRFLGNKALKEYKKNI